MPRPRSLRARLSLAVAALVLAVLAVVGLVVYYETERRLVASLNDSLGTLTAQVMTGANVQNGRFMPGPGLDEEPDADDPRVPGLGIVVSSPDGDTISATGPYGPLLTASTLAAANHGVVTSEVRVDTRTGARIRVLTTPLREDGSTVAVFSVSSSQEPLFDTLEQLRMTMLVLLPLAAAAAALLGYLLIGRMLRPLASITRTAAAISPSDLSQRLGSPHGSDEVGRLAASFDAMLDRLEESFVRERRFVSDASHELRTPVAAVSAIVAVTRERPRSAADYERALDDVAAENERLKTLVERLLELARGDAERMDAPQRVDLSELLRDVVASLDVIAQARGLELVGEIDDGLAVDGDGDGLVQLFVNLVENAIKYTQRGEVRVVASRMDATVRVEVRDTGAGISREDLPHVFERFYRGDPSRSTDGTGLGLPIAADIAEAHGGRIKLESIQGHGTVCIVTLPSAAPEEPKG